MSAAKSGVAPHFASLHAGYKLAEQTLGDFRKGRARVL